MMSPCLDCGVQRGPLFLWLSDDMWKQIGCKESDYLCAHCIIDRLEEVRTYIYAVGGDEKESQIVWARRKITLEDL